MTPLGPAFRATRSLWPDGTPRRWILRPVCRSPRAEMLHDHHSGLSREIFPDFFLAPDRPGARRRTKRRDTHPHVPECTVVQTEVRAMSCATEGVTKSPLVSIRRLKPLCTNGFSVTHRFPEAGDTVQTTTLRASFSSRRDHEVAVARHRRASPGRG